MALVGTVAQLVLAVYLLLLLARWVADFALTLSRRARPKGGAATALEALWVLTDPPLKFLRRHVPPLRVGSVAFDIAFLLLVLVVVTAQAAVGRIGG